MFIFMTVIMIRICETVLTTPRAAADRLRALGYLVWMHTIDI